MNFIGDYHTHSTYSDGESTIEEIAFMAEQKGLKEVAITDHGPANIGAGVKNSETYLQIKEHIKGIAPKFPELNILLGAESNLIGLKGEIDIDPKVIKELDFLLVGLHPYVKPIDLESAWKYVIGNRWAKFNKGQREKIKNNNTKSLNEAITKNDCLAVTHPGLKMPIDLKELGKRCVKTNTAFEINTGHTFPCLEDVLEVAKTGVEFIVNSDAHFPKTVGEFGYGAEILKKANIPNEQVLNYRTDNYEL
ncbi:putative hydrolase [Desulfonispora thiosulfatigenes DSM 11270]|uniref:Putative hydrolase n=1 Tax=Desulfonispora thiosulfatigenes DSM 11270 TaxID=656914 RepID=A0A1W1UWF3_DESTI|nr:PHP domain-containing protein [Desulfonispora thiosulfatigenes]SMB85495.1 putative hydrolase [Desulfonispora thiosulfatigenes DSM 11270]